MPENKNETFGLFVRNQQVERIIRRELKKLNGDGNAKPPFNLSAQVRRYALVGELRHGGEAATGHRQSQPRDARGRDRHDAPWRTRLNSAKVNLRVNLMVARLI